MWEPHNSRSYKILAIECNPFSLKFAPSSPEFSYHLEAAGGVGFVRTLGDERAERQLQQQKLLLLLLPRRAVAQLRVHPRLSSILAEIIGEGT